MNKFLKGILTTLSLVPFLLGCQKPEQGGTSANDPEGTVSIISAKASDYTIVYPASAYTKGIKDAKAFRAAVYAATKVALPIQSDATAPSTSHSINIGATKAALGGPLSAAADHEWVITSDDKGDIFIGSKDENYTCHALYVFEYNVLKDMDACGENKLKFFPSASCGENPGEALTLKHFVANASEYYELKPVLVCYSGVTSSSDIYSTQGAVGHGDHAWFAFRDNANGGAGEKCIVVKCEIPSGKQVGETKQFVGTHANSMAYCDNDGMLYVVSANGVTTINRIDPISMEVGTATTFSPSITAITYNDKQKKFMLRSGQNLYITDPYLNVLKHTTKTDGTAYTAQGVGSDDTYCYFPVSPNSSTSEKVNYLLVYDWNGVYKGLIKIPLSTESEDMWVEDGHYYVNFAESNIRTKGHSVYELVITAYEYRTKLTKQGATINL